MGEGTMKGSAFLVMVGFSAAVVLIGQVKARAYPGDLAGPGAMSSPTPAALYGVGAPCGGVAAPAGGEDLVRLPDRRQHGQ